MTPYVKVKVIHIPHPKYGTGENNEIPSYMKFKLKFEYSDNDSINFAIPSHPGLYYTEGNSIGSSFKAVVQSCVDKIRSDFENELREQVGKAIREREDFIVQRLKEYEEQYNRERKK